MKKELSNDPFENAFLDYFSGKRSVEIIIHSNKSDVDGVPVEYFFREFDQMPEIEKSALGHCTGKILDIGAGSGCHSLILQKQGKDVTALDIRQAFVDIMKKRGLNKVVLADIYSYNQNTFDTLLMLMNGIGFTGDLNGLARFLAHSRRLIRPGGQILLDSTDILYLYEEEDGSVMLNLNEDYYGEVVYRFEYNGVTGKPFKWLFVDYSLLSEMAGQAGYNCELLMEDGFIITWQGYIEFIQVNPGLIL
ncbi:MAG: class I SAM-dependent methyltransferase [Bacteroidales bacterium]